jgi:DNA-binding transcriptional LysR family regulator
MLNGAHLSKVDLNLLVLFHVVLEEGHVGRAASRLSLTPSAVSHGLGRLRLLFNDPLFLRMPKGVVPSERAAALREPVAQVLSTVQGMLAATAPFDPGASRRRFVIGGPDAVLASITVPLLERVGAEAPHVDIGLVHLLPQGRGRPADGPWAECLHKLERRELDVAVLPLRVLPRRFHAQRLYDEEFVVAMRRGHPFERDCTEANFVASKHLLVSISGDPRGFVDTALGARGRKRRVVLTVPSFSMALEVLADTDLLAALPRRLVRQQAARFGLSAAELPFKRRADPVQAIATKASMMDAGIAWMMKVLADLHARRK